jgi:hypothetical protein
LRWAIRCDIPNGKDNRIRLSCESRRPSHVHPTTRGGGRTPCAPRPA